MAGTGKSPTVYTIGHSTRSAEEFVALLRENGVTRLLDVRTLPGSRHNPQFNEEALRKTLREAGIAYEHVKGLGGLRKPRKDSPNTGWRSAGFRAYADYMLTGEFAAHLDELMERAARETAAVMCAEAVPWRCHRWLLADALTVRGVEVRHIMGEGKAQRHELTGFAKVRGGKLTYPGA
ncbi:MAG: DUF488 domain-containing protein [Nitrospirota bacterium]|jgi:uncharacterized protein (DUF488 family)